MCAFQIQTRIKKIKILRKCLLTFLLEHIFWKTLKVSYISEFIQITWLITFDYLFLIEIEIIYRVVMHLEEALWWALGLNDKEIQELFYNTESKQIRVTQFFVRLLLNALHSLRSPHKCKASVLFPKLITQKEFDFPIQISPWVCSQLPCHCHDESKRTIDNNEFDQREQITEFRNVLSGERSFIYILGSHCQWGSLSGPWNSCVCHLFLYGIKHFHSIHRVSQKLCQAEPHTQITAIYMYYW